MMLSIDGADVPIRPEEAKGSRPGRKSQRAKQAHWKGQWRESKGSRFYLVYEDRIIHLISWHQIQSTYEKVFASYKERALNMRRKAKL